MAHATLLKFGYPDSCVAEDAHWAVLLRPQQVTLGALILCAKSDAPSFATLPENAFVALGKMTKRIERGLMAFQPFDRINYLALMMVDPHVHFHVLPRYSSQHHFAGVAFADVGWPTMPDLKSFTEISADVRQNLLSALKASINGDGPC